MSIFDYTGEVLDLTTPKGLVWRSSEAQLEYLYALGATWVAVWGATVADEIVTGSGLSYANASYVIGRTVAAFSMDAGDVNLYGWPPKIKILSAYIKGSGTVLSVIDPGYVAAVQFNGSHTLSDGENTNLTDFPLFGTVDLGHITLKEGGVPA